MPRTTTVSTSTSLVVAEAWVGKNMMLKRGRPRARGRFGKIMKPFSEMTIKVRQVGEYRVMGQKVNPIGMRLQVNRTWDSRWFADVEGLRQPAARRPEDARVHP